MRVEASDLQRIVRKTSKYLTRVEFMPPVLKSLYFDGHTIRAYGKEQGIEYHGSQDYGRFMVMADLFKTLLPKKGFIDITADSGELSISSDTGSQRYVITPHAEYEFPDEPKSFKDVPPEFMDAINKVAFAMTKNWTRTRIRGVFVRDNTFYATDNLRIARYRSKIDHKGEAIIPDTLLNLVSKDKGLQGYAEEEGFFWMKFKEAKDGGEIKSTMKPKKPSYPCDISNMSRAKKAWITRKSRESQTYEAKGPQEDTLKQVSEDSWTSFANKVIDPYPTDKLDQAIDTFPGDEKFVEYDQSRLIDVVRRAMPHAYVRQPKIDLKLEKDKMVVETESEAGSFKEHIDVRYEGASKSISVDLLLFKSGVERFNRFAYDPDTHHMYFKNDEGLEMLMLCQRSEIENK